MHDSIDEVLQHRERLPAMNAIDYVFESELNPFVPELIVEFHDSHASPFRGR